MERGRGVGVHLPACLLLLPAAASTCPVCPAPPSRLHPPTTAPMYSTDSPPQWESRVNRTLTVDATAAVLSGAWEEDLAPVAVAVRWVAGGVAVAAWQCRQCSSGWDCSGGCSTASQSASSSLQPWEQARCCLNSLPPLPPPPIPCSYDADDEEEAQQAQQQQAAAQVAEEEEAAVATVTEAPAPAKPESPQRTLKLSPAAEAAVGGLIEQANAAAYKVAEGLAAMSADEAAADAVATAGLVGAAQARSAKVSSPRRGREG